MVRMMLQLQIEYDYTETKTFDIGVALEEFIEIFGENVHYKAEFKNLALEQILKEAKKEEA
jgi:hypothetical protein